MSQVATKSTTVGRSSGTISVTIGPITKMDVKLYVSCSEVPGSGLHQACPQCLNQVFAPRTCINHGLLDAVVKVYRDGETVFEITEDDIIAMKLETAKNFVPIAIIKATDVVDLLTESFKKYNLVPDGFNSGLIYAAVADNLVRNRQVLMGKYSLSSGRENLAAILPDDGGGLALIHLPFQDIRRPKPQLSLPQVTQAIQKGIKVILGNLPTTFDYDTCVDDYDAALQKVILTKTTAQITKESEAIKLATVTKITEGPGKGKRREPKQRKNLLRDLTKRK